MSSQINEELMYMKYLLGYKRGKIISEQTQPAKTNTTQQSGGNKYKTPIVSVKERVDGDTTFWDVEGFSYFPTSETKSDAAKNFVTKIKTEVFTNAKLKDQKNAEFITVTLAEIRGGASNYLNGVIDAEVKFEGENYRTPIALSKKPEQTENFTTNKGYASNRAKNFWDYLLANLPTEIGGKKIRISNAVKASYVGYVVDTGGKTDTDSARDWTNYPIPGQHVYIKMTIQLRPKLEPDKTKSLGCFWKSSIRFSFGDPGDSTVHNCDMAVFDIYANGVPVGHIDLGNGKILSKKNNLYFTKGLGGATVRISPSKTEGGPVAGEIIISDEALAKKIVDASIGGEVKISAQGKKEEDYISRGFICTEPEWCSTHSEIPYIKVTNSTGKFVFDGRPTTSAKLFRCGASAGEFSTECPLWQLGEFNPCATSATEGTLSKTATK